MRANLIVVVATFLYLFTCPSGAATGQVLTGRNGEITPAEVTSVAPAANHSASTSPQKEKDEAAPLVPQPGVKDVRPVEPVSDRVVPLPVAEATPETVSSTTPAPVSDGVGSAASVGTGNEPPPPTSPPVQKATCQNTIEADIVALDYAFYYNRYGAMNPGGMIYALRGDVVPQGWNNPGPAPNPQALQEGKVQLRQGKRARPLVLRVNAGDCIRIKFQNLLAPQPKCHPSEKGCDQPHTRTASAHVQGLQPVNSIQDDGSYVGRNPSSLVPPGGRAVYTYYAEREGGHLLYSTAATTGGQGDGGSLAFGLFGSVNVEPRNSEWYRSQVTEEDMRLATTERGKQTGHPLIDYKRRYPKGHPLDGRPIFSILDGNQIVHSDLNAIITYKGLQQFPKCTLGTTECPPDSYRPIAVVPNRHEPFREFTVIYHDEIKARQAFVQMEDDENNPNRYLAHTLHSVRDAFAINYGTGGIGAEILANRFRVGPVYRCDECLYEEFFLSSWAVGDPAMIVDRPANEPDTNGKLIEGPKATRAFFPDDPSNVHHSYLNDHVKFRVMHAGPKEHHIHHLHAHQWLHTPDSDTSTMLDSQAIGPGSSFNTELVHGGAGNRSKTPGDSIFHCHFYPHFAQGMWELMRVHDVFEEGTKLDAQGRPASGERALPDGEIMAGTPIPAVVPIPTLPMAPMPQAQVSIRNGQVQISGNGNPGYPFFVPSEAGHRPPRPPLDTVHDGGLPRHIILAHQTNEVRHHKEKLPQFSLVKARTDFDKMLLKVRAMRLPEEGTPAEVKAMEFHARREHASITPEGNPRNFITNGLPRRPGAPFADPCRRDDGTPVVSLREEEEAQQDFAANRPHRPDKLRVYKAAIFQMDVIFNKAGWHFPQQRISTLWNDVLPTLNGQRAPEPLFIRANSDDCALHYLTNLVPRVYKLDDFQVRTPTDIMGQHVHLVKFDVTSSDGGANGFNYEDGSLSPEEVHERIDAINAADGLLPYGGSGNPTKLKLKPHPFFGAGPDANGDGEGDWLGAQTTVQRWFVDKVLDNAGRDRTQRTAFTHDHFGPSTHQQVGQYAGVAVEPEGSKWRDPFTGTIFGGDDVRPLTHDGGPTSWRADILLTSTRSGTKERVIDRELESYREFLIEFTDFQHAYEAGRGGTAVNPVPDHDGAINPPAKKEVGLPLLVQKREFCPNSNERPPCPEAVAAADVGTMVINYRNEPIPLRIRDPRTGKQTVDARTGQVNEAGDLAHVYRSLTNRADTNFNRQPTFYPPLTHTPPPSENNPFSPQPGDPFTPLLTAYEDDPVQIRVLVGAHEEGHNFTINGIKWLMEPSYANSGYRNSQMMGISEHFEFVVPGLPVPDDPARAFRATWMTFDFRYAPGAAVDDQWNGLWGIFRTVRPIGGNPEGQNILRPLPGNEDRRAAANPALRASAVPLTEPLLTCPQEAVERMVNFDVTAMLARDALAAHPQHRGTLVYNARVNHKQGKLHDPTALMFFHTSDLHPGTKRLLPGREVEPLILRAAAGDCIKVTLRNNIRLGKQEPMLDLPGFNTLPMIVENFNANEIRPSKEVGLHPQLVYYNIRSSDGMNVGLNFEVHRKMQTAAPGKTVEYYWYAGGVISENERRRLARVRSEFILQDLAGKNLEQEWVHRPFEFGATNLMPADPIKHSNKGAIGALIIEPRYSKWRKVGNSYAQADITVNDAQGNARSVFREFVLLFQNDLNLRYGDYRAVENTAEAEDSEDSGQKAFNYRTEPLWKRMFFLPCTPLSGRGSEDTCPPVYRCDPTRTCDFTRSLSNTQMNLEDGVSPLKDPVTPIFRAPAGAHVRFRVLHPGGHARNNSFVLHGHTWEEQPYTNGSTQIGHNPLSEWKPSQTGHGPSNHFDVDLRIGAGGRFNVTGDYLYRDQASFTFDGGLWGVFRVEPNAPGMTAEPSTSGSRETPRTRRARRGSGVVRRLSKAQ